MLAAVTTDPLADIVSRQYERWVYPMPIWDLPGWLQGNWQWFDPSHAHRMLWPDRDYWSGMDILVAGCGTNQAAVIAYTNPEARVLGIDVSSTSLAHHRHLAEEYALDNLELLRLPIEDIGTLGRDFDLIMSTGVLHHLADPERGIQALAPCLRPDGVMGLMLYATHGRIGVQIMQSVFDDLALQQDDEGLDMIRDAIDQLGPQHPLMSYLAIAPDLGDDEGLMDTFLPGRERTYTIDECRDLVASAGLAFQDIFLKSTYYPPVASTSPFMTAVSRLPREQQWSIMQRVTATNACHFFMACREDRPRESYLVEFDYGDPMRFVPSFRKGSHLHGANIHGPSGNISLTPLEAALVEGVDGNRSIREIADRTARSGSFARSEADDLAARSVITFQALWQRDYLAMGLP